MANDAQSMQAKIAAYAEKAWKSNPEISKSQYIDRFYMDRFLSRIFSDTDDNDWVLKGGTGIIARVPLGRRTTDLDLFTTGYSLESAQQRLINLSKIDLRDGFSFEFVKEIDPFDREQQTNVELKGLSFNVYVAGARKNPLSVDLAVGKSPIGRIVTTDPKERIEIPEFKYFPYRLYPIEHQAAEKVCATIAEYGDGFSSREKDLVDLVVIATQSSLDGNTLSKALTFETDRRNLSTIVKFSVPSNWGKNYRTEAQKAPACAKYLEIGDALALMEVFIDPALNPDHSGTWNPEFLRWE